MPRGAVFDKNMLKFPLIGAGMTDVSMERVFPKRKAARLFIAQSGEASLTQLHKARLSLILLMHSVLYDLRCLRVR